MNNNNYAVIMAGGIGSRFWPMSKESRPKQFIDILGTGETLIQQTFRRLSKICPKENILIVTNKNYKELDIVFSKDNGFSLLRSIMLGLLSEKVVWVRKH